MNKKEKTSTLASLAKLLNPWTCCMCSGSSVMSILQVPREMCRGWLPMMPSVSSLTHAGQLEISSPRMRQTWSCSLLTTSLCIMPGLHSGILGTTGCTTTWSSNCTIFGTCATMPGTKTPAPSGALSLRIGKLITNNIKNTQNHKNNKYH